MNITASSKWLFLVTGIFAVACGPAILLAECFHWPQSPFHGAQFFSVLLCLSASVVFLSATRGSRFGLQRWLATVAVSLCSLWLAFVAYVYLTFNLRGM